MPQDSNNSNSNDQMSPVVIPRRELDKLQAETPVKLPDLPKPPRTVKQLALEAEMRLLEKRGLVDGRKWVRPKTMHMPE